MASIYNTLMSMYNTLAGHPAPAPSEITAEDATAATPDVDLAFNLQFEEAVASSTSAALFRDDFDLQLHDRKLAEEILAIPDEEWQATGYHFQRPYTFGSTSATGGSDLGFTEQFGLYFKGLVVEDEKNKAKLGAIGVAIFDSRNGVVFEAAKELVLPEAEMRDEVAELEAFVMGLEFALNLELSRVSYFCLDFDVDHFLNASEKPKDAKAAELVNGANLLKKRFLRCESSAAACKSSADLVLQLARSVIVKKAGTVIRELLTCNICLEDVESVQMFETGNCQHCFCYSCLQKHVEIKVRERRLPRCPQPNCGLELNLNVCRIFLSPELCIALDQLVREYSVPASEKLYCPNPRCSNMMSKTEALANAMSFASANKVKLTACSWCVKCRSLFCMNCKVLWHSNMSCDKYKKKLKSDSKSNDAKLKSLAGQKKWRQCPRCSHMVELALGCNHIYCKCGHQFCYICGKPWVNKKATCSCKLWSVENLLLRRGADHAQRRP